MPALPPRLAMPFLYASLSFSAPFPAMASPFEARLGLLKCAARLGNTLHRRLPLSLRRLLPCYVFPIITGPPFLSCSCPVLRLGLAPSDVPLWGQSPPRCRLRLSARPSS